MSAVSAARDLACFLCGAAWPRKRIALNVDPALADLIEADAERRAITVTEWLRRASLRYLERPSDEVRP